MKQDAFGSGTGTLTPALRRFTRAAENASSAVIANYSTSFGLATSLLGRRHRGHVKNIYAMVRIADEIVDGVSAEAGLTVQQQHDVLDQYEHEVHRAMQFGYSSDLVIHAFARTARAAGIDTSLTAPFFASMRRDLASVDGDQLAFDTSAHARYVHGSAEVVGLMCLRIFVRDGNFEWSAIDGSAGVDLADDRSLLVHGARQLGAAFQNINFLRDLADDTSRLGRNYLTDTGRLDNAGRDVWVATVRRQLTEAEEAIPLLPKDARAAVRSALALFNALTNRIARTPAAELYRTRVRVANPMKLLLTARALVTTCLEGK